MWRTNKSLQHKTGVPEGRCKLWNPSNTVKLWFMSHNVLVIKRHWCCVLNHTGSQVLMLYLHISRILVLYSICSLQLYHSDFIILWLRGTGVVYSITMVLHTVIKSHWCCVLNHTGSKILVLHLHISRIVVFYSICSLQLNQVWLYASLHRTNWWTM